MSVDERARHELHTAAARVLGPENAATLMAMLPGTGWGDVATKADLEAFTFVTRRDLDDLRREVDARSAQLAERIDGVERQLAERIDGVERQLTERIDGVERQLTERIEAKLETVEHRVLATLEARLREQTRTMVLALVTAMVSMGGVAASVALAR